MGKIELAGIKGGVTSVGKTELAGILGIEVNGVIDVLKQRLLGVIGGVGKLKVLKTREDTVEAEEIVGVLVVLILHSWETEIIRLFLRLALVRTGVSEDDGKLVMGSGLEGVV